MSTKSKNFALGSIVQYPLPLMILFLSRPLFFGIESLLGSGSVIGPADIGRNCLSWINAFLNFPFGMVVLHQ